MDGLSLQVTEVFMLMEVCGFGILQRVNGMILVLLLAHKGIKVLKGKLVQPVHKALQVQMVQMVPQVKMVQMEQMGMALHLPQIIMMAPLP